MKTNTFVKLFISLGVMALLYPACFFNVKAVDFEKLQGGESLYSCANGLKVRKYPLFKSKMIDRLRFKETVTYTGETGKVMISATICGKRTRTPLVQILYKGGKKGWVFGGGLRMKPLLFKPVQMKQHSKTVLGLTASKDGSQLLSTGSDKKVILWDIKSGKILKELKGHQQSVWSGDFTKDGTAVITGDDHGNIYLWDLAALTYKIIYKGKGTIYALRLTDSGDSIFYGAYKQLRKLQFPSAERLQVLSRQRHSVFSISLAAHAPILACAGGDKKVKIYNTETIGDELRPFQSFIAHKNAIRAVAVTPDGKKVISGGDDDKAIVWDVKTGKQLQQINLSGDVHALSTTSNGKYVVSGDWSGGVTIWQIDTGKIVFKSKEYLGKVYSIAITPDDSTLFAGTRYGVIYKWDISKLML